MAVLSKEDFLSKLQGLIGDSADDETLAVIEDFTDTYNDLEARTNDTEDWKTKYEENDKEWRDKYKARFFSGDPSTSSKEVKDEQKKDVTDDTEVDEVTYDDLFKEREGD